MAGWVINELPRWIIFGAWLLINIALFIFQFYSFQATDRYYYMRIRTREALAFARGPALPINFNVIIILLPVCRNLISFLRGTGRCPPRTVKRLLDKNLTFHKAIAWMIVACSAIHVIAHWYNYERLVGNLLDLNRWPWEKRNVPLQAQPPISPTDRIPDDPITICFVTAAGITGHVITVALFLMVTSSLEFIRRSYFEVFWYTHHLFIVFLLGLAAHQAQMLLPVQTNSPDRTAMDAHDPEFCSQINRDSLTDVTNIEGNIANNFLNVTFSNNSEVVLCPAATFAPAPPCSWKYMLGGLIIYAIERIVRFIRSFRSVVIIKVVEHPSKTIEIQMRQKGFFAEAGQYVFINVPSVAFFEWHPFTLTSAPEEDYFSVHIRIVGDWTEEVARQMGVGRDEFTQSWQLPKIAIDGPFGTASEDVFFHNVGLLVGAGIGVTPFASILKELVHRFAIGARIECKKVFFIWVARSQKQYEWFSDIIRDVEEADKKNNVEIHIFVTQFFDKFDLRTTMLYVCERHFQKLSGKSLFTGLRAVTHFGRPDFNQFFDSLQEEYILLPKIGVFSCGPPGMTNGVEDACAATNRFEGPAFIHHYENF